MFTSERIRTTSMASFVFIVNSEHNSAFALIIDSKQTKICRSYIENTKTFKDNVGCIMRYVVVFWVWTEFLNKYHVNLYHRNPMGKVVRNPTRDN